MTNKKFFITYGTREFKLQKKQLIQLVNQTGCFDFTVSYSLNDIEKDFINKHKEIFNQKKGGGFWIWKSKIINQQLKKIDDGDIVVYLDSGSSFNPDGTKRLNEYFKILRNSNHGILQFQMPHIEEDYTIKEIFDYFDCRNDETITKTGQLWGGLIFIKKTKETMDYFNEYEKLLEYDHNLITDVYSNNQIKTFVSNRHDQSIFSGMSKTRGVEIIRGESYFAKNPNLQYSYPFLAVRRKKISNKQKLIEEILYFTKKTKPVYFK